MSVYRRAGKRTYYVELRQRGVPRLRLSTGTTIKAVAVEFDRTLVSLARNGRRDLLGLLADGKVSIQGLHDAYRASDDQLDQLAAGAASREVGDLLDEWFAWLASPLGISSRTNRRFAENTVRRYRMSWEKILRALPEGRKCQTSGLTSGFVADFRADAAKLDSEPGTINRDLCALMSFRSWCLEHKELSVASFKIRREKEPDGRERWLTPNEIDAVRSALPAEWWPLFALLLYTGVRIGEAQGLRWRDVDFDRSRVLVHAGDRRCKSTGSRRLKTAGSDRDVPMPAPLMEVLRAFKSQTDRAPADLVFSGPLLDYPAAYRTWAKAAVLAGLHDGGEKPRHNATPHDLRHTYAVHAAMAGVPIARLQKLLGHATPMMTMRYMKHAPQEYFGVDAEKIAASYQRPAVVDSSTPELAAG